MVYAWKYSILPVSAQVAGEYLEGLEKEHKALTPELILDKSRDEKAVLHDCFEWDNEKAAEGYRLSQASYILRNITVKVVRKSDDTPKTVRAFVNVADESTKEKGSYVSVSVAMLNSTFKNQVMENALYELMCFKKKYLGYTGLEKVFTAIDELAATLHKKNFNTDSQS